MDTTTTTTATDNIKLYTVEQEIGKGSGGTVYRAKRKKDGKTVVIKECYFVLNKTNQCLNEWNIIKSLKPHPNIITFYDFYTTPLSNYIVMENCQETVYDLLIRNNKISEPIVKKIIKEILYGLYHLKKNGIIHRDIKPENIGICNDKFKLIDFGLATFYNPLGKSSNVGTPNYIAPEYLNRYFSPTADFSGDMHAVGVLTYELLTGYPPYNSQDVKTVFINILHNNRQYDDLLKETSEHAQDFINKIIDVATFVYSPSDRMTVEKALEHHWIKHLQNY